MPLKTKNISYVLGAFVVGSLVAGAVMSLPRGLQSDVYADQQTRARQASAELATAQDLSSAFRNVADTLRPSVVSISTVTKAATVTTGRRRSLPRGFGGIPPWMLEDFFGDMNVPQQRRQRPAKTGMGSGVIVSEDGYVLTNNHVVEDADEVEVELSDGTKTPAEVVGTDPDTDLAVLKIEAVGLQSVRFGSSDDIRVGDWVLAIGSPFGLDQTVTAGIISGKNRVQGIVGDGDGYEDFLQTDAAINPGNSGGPLVNLRGELVGINTAILSRSGASAGIGFAIPVSLAKPVMNAIVETGEVRRGFFGAQVGDVTNTNARELGLKVQRGALISGVLENKPAANAGIQPGDVVTKLDGREIASGTQLRNYVASRPPGSKLEVELNRDGEQIQLSVQLEERTDEAMAMFEGGSGDSLFGANFVRADSEAAAQLGIRGLNGGLIVTSVQDDSLAAKNGLQAGDVLESVGGVRVNSVNDLREVFMEAKRQGVNVRIIIRRGNTRFLRPWNPTMDD